VKVGRKGNSQRKIETKQWEWETPTENTEHMQETYEKKRKKNEPRPGCWFMRIDNGDSSSSRILSPSPSHTCATNKNQISPKEKETQKVRKILIES